MLSCALGSQKAWMISSTFPILLFIKFVMSLMHSSFVLGDSMPPDPWMSDAVLMFGVCTDNRLSQPRQHTATANIRVVFGLVWPQHIHSQWWLHILKVIIRDAIWCRLQCNQSWNGVFLYTTPVQGAMDGWFEDICHKVSDLLSYGYWLYK